LELIIVLYLWGGKPILEGFLASERVQRRLAAIIAADVAGYSRMMFIARSI
jgi:hypothetical protein